MPVTDEDVSAIKARVMDLEQTVGDLLKQLKANPESAALAADLKTVKDEITKLNLLFGQTKPLKKEGDHAADNKDTWEL